VSEIPSLIICRCREVTEEEIRSAIEDGATTLAGVKRRTHAGMGLCQGKSCSRLVSRLIADQAGIPMSRIEPPSSRPPVRPVSLKLLSLGRGPR
jgi:NAD(P)H-nitrite reductase large subunit